MLFVALLNAIPGSTRHLIRGIKNIQMTEGVTMENIYGLFGQYDHIIIFEAESHAHADIFLSQFKDLARILVRSATEANNLRWTSY